MPADTHFHIFGPGEARPSVRFGIGSMQKTTVRGWGLAPVVLAGIMIAAPLATAQDSHWDPQAGPSIVATAGMVPATDLAEVGQRHGFRDAGLRVTVPLLGGWDWDSSEMSKFRLLAHAGFKTDSSLLEAGAPG